LSAAGAATAAAAALALFTTHLGKESFLDISRMQKLTDLGFNFRMAEPYRTWDKRLEEIRLFKEENGHVKPPKESSLYNWIAWQRLKYKIRKEGKNIRMTDEQFQQLEDLGIAIKPKAGKDGRTEPKPWEYQFKQLCDYKEFYGNTLVPITYPVLGEWVYRQRV